ncbi:uncharacterized protein EI97DRAFT_220777 [Westerdykella ornata]|uniref:Uncharacterized protein n=1 Tax=Westerdykella ornata TaxID=318751 RepID=A0A6A6JR14_WESOR|nr:uncharacterized protein EI97DRAFT_220777 [Westerdykella ornata]KAF2278827.1 hypothetical protein EI97DRAFT_220777 [Westerdykella ornata]
MASVQHLFTFRTAENQERLSDSLPAVDGKLTTLEILNQSSTGLVPRETDLVDYLGHGRVAPVSTIAGGQSTCFVEPQGLTTVHSKNPADSPGFCLTTNNKPEEFASLTNDKTISKILTTRWLVKTFVNFTSLHRRLPYLFHPILHRVPTVSTTASWSYFSIPYSQIYQDLR